MRFYATRKKYISDIKHWEDRLDDIFRSDPGKKSIDEEIRLAFNNLESTAKNTDQKKQMMKFEEATSAQCAAVIDLSYYLGFKDAMRLIIGSLI